MTNQNKLTRLKLEAFIKFSMLLYGKEFELPSNNFFSFSKVLKDEELPEGVERYTIQYGYPQSGGVFITFDWEANNEKTFKVIRTSVNAIDGKTEPTENNNDAKAVNNIIQDLKIPGITITSDFGENLGAKSFDGIEEIAKNPNATKMLDDALNDLTKARVIQPCRIEEANDEIQIAASIRKTPKH